MFNLITSNNYQKSNVDWMANSTCPYRDNDASRAKTRATGQAPSVSANIPGLDAL